MICSSIFMNSPLSVPRIIFFKKKRERNERTRRKSNENTEQRKKRSRPNIIMIEVNSIFKSIAIPCGEIVDH